MDGNALDAFVDRFVPWKGPLTGGYPVLRRQAIAELRKILKAERDRLAAGLRAEADRLGPSPAAEGVRHAASALERL